MKQSNNLANMKSNAESKLVPFTLGKIPKLRTQDDEEIAAELSACIRGAQAAIRDIIKCGFLTECIEADLPKGQLQNWLRHYLPEVTLRTCRRWRQVARNLSEAIGLSFKRQRKLEFHKHILSSIEKVPANVRAFREKLDSIIDGRTQRELLLGFKQVEFEKNGDFHVKRGRLKGHGGNSKDHLADLRYAREEARLEALELESEQWALWIAENSELKDLPMMSVEAWEKHFDAVAEHWAFCRAVGKNRKGALNPDSGL